MGFSYGYFSLVILLLTSISVALLMLGVNYLAAPRSKNDERLTSYECGFDPFGYTRVKFDVQYYLIGLMFILFDFEVIFLFPVAISLHVITFIGLFSAFVFLATVTLGFLYEWVRGVFIW